MMKKLIFLPLIFVAFIFLSHTKDDIKAKDISFTSFLQLFPKEKLTYKISLKQIIKSTKKELAIKASSPERENVNSIFKKYLPNSDEGNRAVALRMCYECLYEFLTAGITREPISSIDFMSWLCEELAVSI